MAAQGFAVSIAGVADCYRDFLDLLVVDSGMLQLPKSCARLACACIALRPSCARMKIESRWRRAS